MKFFAMSEERINFSVNTVLKSLYDKIKIIRRAFIMVKEKKPIQRVRMTEGKRNIIHQLLEEYVIQPAEDI